MRVIVVIALAMLLATGHLPAGGNATSASAGESEVRTAVEDTAVMAELKTVTLDVPDMSCAACPITVRKSLERVPGVIEAEASLEARQATVTYDATTTDLEALIAATTNVGYPSTVAE